MTSRSALPLLLSLAACSSADAGALATTGLESGPSGATDVSGKTGSTLDPTGAESSGGDVTGDDTSADTGTSGISGTTGDPTGGPLDEPVLPLDGPCLLGPASPGRLAVITNDFIEPASLHVLDLASQKLSADITLVPSDPALAWGAGKLVVLGRYGFNTLDVLDGDTYASLSTHSVKIDGVADANPQALTFGPDDRAYLTAFASATLPIYDLDKPPAEAVVGGLDLAAFADRDGSPEPGVSFTCGGTLIVGIQRLVNFVPVDLSYLVAVDLGTEAPIDLDPDTDGPQGLPLLGPWPKQVRNDPADPTGYKVLVLTSGIERVDLVYATSSWAVTPEQLAAVGIEGYDLQAFEVAADGASAYVLATDGDYPASAVYHVTLDDASAPIPMVTGLTTRERVIERIADRLWIGDADPEDSRLRIFDLTQDPAAELPPIPSPGAPYLFLPIP